LSSSYLYIHKASRLGKAGTDTLFIYIHIHKASRLGKAGTDTLFPVVVPKRLAEEDFSRAELSEGEEYFLN
jgi:hypothetical protein